jgi:hypothetical protein
MIYDNAPTEVQVQGPLDSVAEVLEQIAWLGAALRVSDTDDGLSLCSPNITIYPGLASEFECDVEFPTRRVTPDQEAGAGAAAGAEVTGQCWHNLFRNPVVVEGYPIPRRSRYNTGLEVPLNMMSRLADSPRIHQVMGTYLLKGFSTAIAPTETLDGSVLWHLYCTEDGSWLPYPDPETNRYAEVSLDGVTGGRHILGWCTEASLFTGELDL